MLFNSPISIRKADQIIDALMLSERDRALDVGCGTGEFLIRIVERNKNVRGLGVDQRWELISAARKAASGRVAEESCEFKEADIQSLSLADHSFELALCIGYLRWGRATMGFGFYLFQTPVNE